jgi:elongation factor G
MKAYQTENIRNMAVIGHGDAGKTQFVSSLLHIAGATQRWGKVDEGTTVTDFDEDSIARKVTLNTNHAYLEHKDTKINLLDTPGYAAFVAHARPALRVADCAVVVVDGVNGIEVQTEKNLELRQRIYAPAHNGHQQIGQRAIRFRSRFGHGAKQLCAFDCSFHAARLVGSEFPRRVDVVHQKAYEYSEGKMREIPVPEEGKGYLEEARTRLIEMVAESDDALLEKYFENGTLADEDLIPNLVNAIAKSRLCPVFAASSLTLVGLQSILDAIVEYVPDPAHHEAERGFKDSDLTGDPVMRKYSDDEPFSGFVFRTIADPFAGRINVMKIISGKVFPDANVSNCSRGASERIGSLQVIQGKNMEKIDQAHTGDIIAVVKLKETQTNDTLCDKQSAIVYPPVEYPEAAISFAIEPKSRADEEKISQALHKILEEDPSLHFDRDAQTKEFILSGSGSASHRNGGRKNSKESLSRRSRSAPAESSVQGNSDGARRSAGTPQKTIRRTRAVRRLQMRFEPLGRGEGFVFEDKIFGGAIPGQFRPAIEKGIIEAASGRRGRGYPLVDFKVTLIDGSYHSVDSDEHSFKAAGRKALKAAIEKTHPILLEPIMDVEVFCPQETSGDIMGDLNSRAVACRDGRERKTAGHQSSSSALGNARLSIEAKSMTAARGSYHMQFSHYDPVPQHLSGKIIEQARAEGRIRTHEEDE